MPASFILPCRNELQRDHFNFLGECPISLSAAFPVQLLHEAAGLARVAEQERATAKLVLTPCCGQLRGDGLCLRQRL